MKVHWIDSGTSPDGFTWTGGSTINAVTRILDEAIIGYANFVHVWWMEKAINAARSVARVKLAGGSATGFLIASDIFITNNHVFEDEQDAKNAELQFNFQMLADDTPATIDVWKCDPDQMFKTNSNLDYSIVKVKKKNEKNVGEVWGFLNLRHSANISRNQHANLIQHPKGRFKEIAFRDNQIKDVTENYIQYLTDTDYGSSGSPVLDDWFNVVALHNQRVNDPIEPSRWYRNQGFRVEAILNDAGTLIP